MNIAFIVVSSLAYADSLDVEKAERRRLSQEMKKLAKRSQWVGVDMKYRQMLELKKADPSFRDHYLGAQAASNIGNVGAAYKRAKKGYEVGQKESETKHEQQLLVRVLLG